MKLMQDMSPSRTYLGVTFPRGEAVELPADFPPDQAQHLLDWGWKEVDKLETVAVVDEDPPRDEPVAAAETEEREEEADDTNAAVDHPAVVHRPRKSKKS